MTLKKARRDLYGENEQILIEGKEGVLKAVLSRYDEVYQNRIASVMEQEDALRDLALSLVDFKDNFKLSWRELNKMLGLPVGDGAIYRLLNRRGEITERTYIKLSTALNKGLEEAGEEPFEARFWIDWKNR